MTTYMQKQAEIKRSWHVVDVQDLVLGKVATQIATLLIGKRKPTYTPHVDGGDYVVVINAAKVRVTGNKAAAKTYFDYSGYPGGLRTQTFAELQAKRPEKIIELAVKRMLPDNKLRRPRLARLKIFAGAEHTHQSQVAQVVA